MYHFLDLTPEQSAARRILLDRYALIAQLSALVPLVAVQLYFTSCNVLTWLQKRSGTADGDLERPPSSPYIKKNGQLGKSRWSFREFQWWCGGRVEVGGWELGKRREVLLAALWEVWLLVLCFAQTGDDYLHFTKRFGIVGASQLPLHYLLAMKTPYSPLQMITRSSHETLNSIHQLLGRVITSLIYLHVAFYLNFYVQKGLLVSKLQQFYIICGVTGVISLTAIGTTALEPLRRRKYRVFYVVHVTVATVLLPVLFFHVSHVRIFLYETAAIYFSAAALRYVGTKNVSGTVAIIPGTNLVEVRVPTDISVGVVRRWSAGQHAYVSLPGHNALRAFRANPFTIASVPTEDKHLRFVARVRAGNTAHLATYAADNNSRQRLQIEGPYGVTTHAHHLLVADRVLLVAGGIGATFVVPLYRQLLADLSPSKNSLRRQKVSFVWVAQGMGEVSWAIPTDRREREGFVERARVCLTREITDAAEANGKYVGEERIGSFTGKEGEENGEGGERRFAETSEGIEMQERKTLLGGEGDEKATTPTSSTGDEQLAVFAGRPDFHRVVDHVFSHGDTEKVAVMICGPTTMGRRVREEVGRWVARGREVWFWEERFDF